MKKPLLIFSGLFVLVTSIWFIQTKNSIVHLIKEVTERESEEEEEKESGVDKQLSMWFLARAYPDPYCLGKKYLEGWEQAIAIRNTQENTRLSNLNGGSWQSIGPSQTIGGRILCIAVNPIKSTSIIVGSASGGMWRTYDGGNNWQPIVTHQPVLGVSSVVYNPSDTSIIYAGTGEVYRVDSTGTTPNPGNTGFNVWKTRGTYGIGILKYAGGVWTTVLNKTTDQLFAIQTIKIDPANANIVYACATDGLYKSTNAGANWTRILDATYVTDVVINGSNIVASVGNLGNTVKGIYKSTNGGTSFTKVTTGLPASFQGFIKFAWLSGNTIFATIGVSKTATTEIYRSTDFGSTWAGLSSTSHTQWQYWCAHTVAINPFNTDQLIFGGVKAYTYTVSNTTKSSALSVHDDIHDIEFDPVNTGTVYLAGDGGMYKSTNSGTSWNKINNGLAATQFYASLGVSTTNATLFVGGLQDNGQVMYNGSTWTMLSYGGGDGTSCAIDPSNNSNILASRDARQIFRSSNGGSTGSAVTTYWGSSADSRTGFVAPIAFSASNSTIVYQGSDNLHKSTNSGASFSNDTYSTATNYIDAKNKTAITLAVSPTNPNKVYVSTSNFAQYDNDVDNLYVTGTPNVLKTTTGNTPFTSIMGTGANTLPNRFVMDFAISKTYDDSVFAAIGGFGTSHVYVTGDGGANWKPVGTGLPDVPFNAVMIDAINPQVLYAAGDMGIYVSPNRGVTWYDYNGGLWDAVQVMDIQPTADGKLVIATHGKGAFLGPRYTAGVLPVTLTSFTGRTAARQNELQWSVSDESALSHYELERSSDGGLFTQIASVQAFNQRAAHGYNYNDALTGTSLSVTKWYYRLKIINANGNYTYSGTVVLDRPAVQTIRMLSNPFQNKIEVIVNTHESVLLNLYDASGKLIRRKEYKTTAGTIVCAFDDVSTLSGGVYFLEAVVDRKRFTEKLIKN